MMLTNSNSLSVSTGCLLLTVYLQVHHLHDGRFQHAHTYILKHMIAPPKILAPQSSKKDSTPIRRIYIV
jgi:hypothetical protein